ncbi:MAG: hypothetical protein DI591_11910 [Citromicrobium sp.]|nr:MAG: hypothetical protein DI591_11910 [Citromicrobium sp.]
MKLGASVAVYSLATLIARSGQVAMLVVFPYFLSPAQYGVLGLLNAIAAFVNMLPLEVSQGMARNIADSEGIERAGIIGTAWWFTLGVMLAGGLVMLIAAPVFSQLLSAGSDITLYLRLAAGFFIATTLVYFTQTLFRWDMRVWDFLWASIAQAFLPLTMAVAGAFLVTDRLAGTIGGQAAGMVLVLIWSLWRLKGALWARFEPVYLRAMLAFSLPLVPASLAILLGVYGSRFVVNEQMSLTDVGLFFFASQLATIPSLAILGVQAALMPHVYSNHANAETPAMVAQVLEIVAAFGLLLTLGMGLLANAVLTVLGYGQYAAVGPIVTIMAPAFLMQQMYIFGPGFALARRTMEQMYVAILGGVSSIAFSIALVKPFGLVGGALATLCSAALFLVVWLWRASVHYPIPFRPGRLAAACALFAVAAIAGLTASSGQLPMLIALLFGFAVGSVLLGLGHLGTLRQMIGDRLRSMEPPVS